MATADHIPAGNNPTDIASAAALLADPSRARILLALADGRALRAMREARTCYDHLAGRIGVEMMAAMLRLGYLSGGDGNFDPTDHAVDGPIGFGHDVDYALTDSGRRFLDDFGVVLETRRKEVRYCVDWSEQRHHLAGALGQGLLARVRELGWIAPSVRGRSVRVTDEGRAGIGETFGIAFDSDGVASPL